MDDKLNHLGQKPESKLATQGEIAKATDELERIASNLSGMVTDIREKITKVADTTTQLSNTANTYKDMLLDNPRPKPTQGCPTMTTLNLAINAVTDRKARRVLNHDLADQDTTGHTQSQVIMNKIADAMKEVKIHPPPEDLAIIQVTELRKGPAQYSS